MKDPVCGMDISAVKFRSIYKGKEYIFCSESCKRKFEGDYNKYAR